MAKAAGVSLRSVQRVWAAHGLAPHRVQTFKLSKHPRFFEKFTDVVVLYVDPPAHAVVLSARKEKSSRQMWTDCLRSCVRPVYAAHVAADPRWVSARRDLIRSSGSTPFSSQVFARHQLDS
jgi:hypothetical protein